MVSVRSIVASGKATGEVIADLKKSVRTSAISPDLVIVFYDCNHDADAIYAFVRDQFPAAALLGGSSCSGAMSQSGLGGAGSIGLLLIEDPDGDYGTAAIRIEGSGADAAEKALHAALERANCAGELPELLWIYQAPGQEEAVIEGLRRVVGDRCPIIGGSAADNDVTGKWTQIGPDGVLTDGIVIGALFSSGGIGFAFQGGYEPSGESGIVTRIGYDCAGETGIVTQARGRQIISINGRPAAEVYNEWTGGAIADKLSGGSILTDTTMYPVGIDAGKIEGITNYLLIHPDKVLPNGALSTFADVEEGAQLFSMRGNKSRLVERAGKVAASAAAHIPGGAGNLAGGLVVYCAGCMLAVGDEMPEVAQAVTDSFEGMPFLGCFTFGEQGAMLDKNTHGNLMISAIAFGK